jgi:dihydroorotate dehydrogenase (fumarate)
MSEMTTSFLGIELKSPVIVGSCPLTLESEVVRQLVSSGVGAIVLPSILQEQLIFASSRSNNLTDAIEQSVFNPQQDKYNGGPGNYLETIKQWKANFSIPIIASIHGSSTGPWLDYANRIEDSGADAIELNWQSGTCNPDEPADQIESRLLYFVNYIRSCVKIPITVKLSERFTNIASIAYKLQLAGANGLVLFAHRPRWKVDIDRMDWTAGWELSPVDSVGAIFEGIVHARSTKLKISIAASGGIRNSEDAIKSMIVGADAVMIVSEVYRQGPDTVQRIVSGIQQYLKSRHFDSLKAFQKQKPTVALGSEYSIRSECVMPMTLLKRIKDPTPVASHCHGDAFGHPTA